MTTWLKLPDNNTGMKSLTYKEGKRCRFIEILSVLMTSDKFNTLFVNMTYSIAISEGMIDVAAFNNEDVHQQKIFHFCELY